MALCAAAMPAEVIPILNEYDPRWPKKAKRLIARLRALGDGIVEVHHIGSTAIPGLPAKPIIDLLPIVESFTWLDGRRDALEAAGCQWKGEYGICHRRYCKLHDSRGHFSAHVHFYELGSRHIVRHLAFRDYLRAHPDVAQAYAAVKRRAEQASEGDTTAYSLAKAEWVSNIEKLALKWASGCSTDTERKLV